MRTQRLFVALTFVNAVMLALSLIHPSGAAAKDVVPVLRGRALEIVDGDGRVRAEIKVVPAQPNFKMEDGTRGYPEAVQLRLITSKGAPNVKVVATEDGSAQLLGGDSSYIQILARGPNPFVKVLNKDGRQQTIKP